MKKLLIVLCTVIGLTTVLLAAIGVWQIIKSLTPSSTSTSASEELATDVLWSRKSKDHELAIVFVHGLGGNAVDTWRNADGVTWFKLLLDDDKFAGSDIATFSFSSALLGRTTAVPVAAKKLAEFLDTECREYTHIAIVAHSLGGLVAAQALPLSDIDHRAHQLATLVTLATPFKGSQLANLASLVPALNNQQIEALRALNAVHEYRVAVWEKFRQRTRDRVRHFAAYETEPVAGVMVVVDKDSATHLADRVFEAHGCDHFTICAPPSKGSAVYEEVRQWVTNLQIDPQFEKKLPEGAVLESFRRAVIGPGRFVISSDCRIPMSSKLTIRPGTTLEFVDGARLISFGRIEARGEADRPIHFIFTGQNTGNIVLKGRHVAKSRFKHCHFRGGSGLPLKKPDPRANEEKGGEWLWIAQTEPNEDGSSLGGAITLLSANRVSFEDCSFVNNRAFQGGALALLDSSRIEFQACHFLSNVSGYGGGALFLQWSNAEIDGSHFEMNETGLGYSSTREQEDSRRRYACGGAIYLGHRSNLRVSDTIWSRNTAEYVAGAIYMLDTHPQGSILNTVISRSVFVDNVARGDGQGGAIRIDDASRLNLTDVSFIRNKAHNGSLGQSVWDKSVDRDPLASGVDLNGRVDFLSAPLSPEWALQNISLFGPDSLPAHCGEYFIFENPMLNRTSYRTGAEKRHVDTVVIHHISAINWEAEDFQKLLSDRKKQDEQFAAYMDQESVRHALQDDADRRFEPALCKIILEVYGFSAHYLIHRDGKIDQLVDERDVAFHAGESRMPGPDNRTGVNEFSIGVELISTHPDDDPSVNFRGVPAYTPKQYDALQLLLLDIGTRHDVPALNIVGHDQVAPSRKKDPGPLFDWDRVRAGYTDDIAIWQARPHQSTRESMVDDPALRHSSPPRTPR